MKFLITKIFYRIEDHKLVVHLWGRGDDEKRKHFRLLKTRPYFYIPEKNEALLKGREHVTEIEHGYKSLFEKPLTKVFVEFPYHVPSVSKGLDSYENDIPFEFRVAYDYGLYGIVEVPDGLDTITPSQIKPVEGTIQPKMVLIDIETDDRKNSLDEEKAEAPILSITLHEMGGPTFVILNGGEQKKWTPASEPVIKEKALAILNENKIECTDFRLKIVASESQLFETLKNYLLYRQPDILVGWYSWDYDFPYIANRASKFKHPRFLEELDLFDMMWGFSMIHRIRFGEPDSHALDLVGKKYLNRGKIVSTHKKFFDTYEQEPERFVAYNMNDVLLMRDLEPQWNVLSHYSRVSRITRTPMAEMAAEIKIVESQIFEMLRGQKIVLPSRSKNKKERIKGAAVLPPSKGIFSDVGVLDFRGEYPAVVRTFNLSPENIIEDDTIPHYNLPLGLKVRKEPRGVLPRILDKFFDEREKMKAEMRKHLPGSPEYETAWGRQETFKALCNSVFGVCLNEYFRLYNFKIGRAIPGTARLHLEWMINQLKQRNVTVLYGDTDSCLFSLPDGSLEKGIGIVEELNQSFDDFARQYGADKHFFKVELKMKYSKWFQAGTKKRYCGRVIWRDGKPLDEPYLDIKGFEVRRSSTPDYTRQLQKAIFELMLTQGEDLAKALLASEICRFRKKDIPIADIGIPVGINKMISDEVKPETHKRPMSPMEQMHTDSDEEEESEFYSGNPIHVKAVRYSNKYLGRAFGRGDKVKLYYVHGVRGYPSTDVIAIERDESPPEAAVIDWGAMERRCLTLPFSDIFSKPDKTTSLLNFG